MTTFYCLRFETPNLEGQVPVFISLRNRVAQLYPYAIIRYLPRASGTHTSVGYPDTLTHDGVFRKVAYTM
jgi:hypothetical protein